MIYTGKMEARKQKVWFLPRKSEDFYKGWTRTEGRRGDVTQTSEMDERSEVIDLEGVQTRTHG